MAERKELHEYEPREAEGLGGRANGDVDEDESDAMNELYGLMDASTMDANVSLHANIRDSAQFAAFDGFAEAEDPGFRTASAMLGDAQPLGDDVFRYRGADVYRGLSAVDYGVQHTMGLDGESHLDVPSGLSLRTMEPRLSEPAPRLFSRMRLEHTHMHVACPLSDFVSRLNCELRALRVDYMFEESGCFWRGMYFPSEPAEAVDFRVYMNSSPGAGANRYLVEFVRRSGCAMAFNRLFRVVRDSLINQKVLVRENGQVIESIEDLVPLFPNSDVSWENKAAVEAEADGELPRPLLSRSTSVTTNTSIGDESTDFDDDLDLTCSDEELFRPLFDMSASEFEDVHVQGLSLISHEAKKGNSARMVAACPGLVDLLVRRLAESSHPEVRRNACTALCAISGEMDLHAELLRASALRILAEVAASELHPATAETQRQAAGALSRLAMNESCRVAVLEAVQDKVAVFDDLAECSDARLTESIRIVRSALSAQ